MDETQLHKLCGLPVCTAGRKAAVLKDCTLELGFKRLLFQVGCHVKGKPNRNKSVLFYVKTCACKLALSVFHFAMNKSAQATSLPSSDIDENRHDDHSHAGSLASS